MDPTEILDVNERLTFRLTDDPEDTGFTCLVKKKKSGLVAVVVSNRDKNRLDIDTVDNIYLFTDFDEETWAAPMRVIQKRSYPLIILSPAGEAKTISGSKMAEPPAPLDEIDAIHSDHAVEASDKEEDDTIEYAEGLETTSALDETPEGAFTLEQRDEDLMGTEEDLTDERLQAAPDSLETTELMPSVDDSLDDVSEIDTSQLDQQLKADIESSLKEERPMDDEPEEDLFTIENEAAAEDLSDMEIVEDQRISLGGIGESGSGFVSPDVESGGEMDMFADTRIGTPDSPMYKFPSHLGRAAGTDVEAQKFVDFFGFALYPVDDEKAQELEKAVLRGEDALKTFSGKGSMEAFPLPANLDSPIKEAMEKVLSRITKLEDTVLGPGETGKREKRALKKIGAVCLELNESGMRIELSEPVKDGGRALVIVDRPWKPPLRFDAMVTVDSFDIVKGALVARLSFDSITPGAAEIISDYLVEGPRHFELLKDVLED